VGGEGGGGDGGGGEDDGGDAVEVGVEFEVEGGRGAIEWR